MKHLCLSLLLLLTVMLTHAVDVTQFYAGKHPGFRNLNIIVWTVYDEYDITGYIVERNGVEIWTQDSGNFWSAGYYFFDPSGDRAMTTYTLKVVFPDGHTEVRGTTSVNNRTAKTFTNL